MSMYTRIRQVLCLLLVGLLVFPAQAFADELSTLTAVADATILSTQPSVNDGASAILRVLGESATTFRNLVRFDLTGITPTATVKVADLKMKVAKAPLASRNQQVRRVTGPTQWTEGGVTWDSRDGVTFWSTLGGDFSATPINTQPSGTTVGATIDWPILTDGVVSNIAQDWLNTPANNLGLLVKDAVETDAARAVLKCLYTGTAVSVANGNLDATLPNLGGACTGTVVPAQSVLFFQTNSNLNRPVAAEFRARMLNPTTVRFTRVTNETSAVNIRWYVAEFERGVNVQRGTVGSQTPATINVGITPVAAVNQAFVLWSKTPVSTDANWGDDDSTIGELTTTSNLQFRATTANAGHAITWQVVEFTNPADILVQKGSSAAMTAGTASISPALGTPVDPNKTFVLVSNRNPVGGSANVGDLMLRGRLTGCAATCTNVTIDRDPARTGVAIPEIFFQVVTLNTGAGVRTGLQNFPAATATQTPALAPVVDPNRSWALLSTMNGGGQNQGLSSLAGSTSLTGVTTFTTAIPPAGNQLTLTRQNTAASADASWYVVEMNTDPPAGVSYSAREDVTPANRPQLDVRFLRDVTLGAVSPGISEVTLNFTYPPGAIASNYQGALVARRNGFVPPTFVPADGNSYSVGSQPIFGETVVSNADNFAASPTNVVVVDENGPTSVIVPSASYSFKVYTRDNNTITGAATPAPPHYSFGNSATSTVATAAGGGANKNWSYKSAGTALAPPGLDPANKVIGASNDFSVHSMSAVTGARNYQPSAPIGTTGGTIQSRPAVIGQSDTSLADCDLIAPGLQPCDVTYVGSADGRVYAFDANTGQRIWVTPVPGSLGALVAVGGAIQGGIAVQLRKFANAAFQAASTTDLLYVGTRELSTSTNKVYALNGNTGAIVWTFNPLNMDGVNSTPAVDYTNNLVWVTSLSNGSTQPSLWKLDSLTGTGIENFNLGDISGSPTPNFDNRVIYATTDSGDLVAVRSDVASCVNTFVSGATSGTGFPLPTGTGNFRDENIFFTTTTAGVGTVRKAHFVYNVACGGETFVAAPGYTNPSGIGTLSGPTYNPLTSFIYVGSSDGRLYKIDPAAGTVLGNRTVNLGITIGEPSLDLFLSRTYVGDTQGRVYSFDIF